MPLSPLDGLRSPVEQHHHDQHDGVDEHAVVRELTEELGKHREQRRRDNGAAHIAQTTQDHEHQDEDGRVEVELGGGELREVTAEELSLIPI